MNRAMIFFIIGRISFINALLMIPSVLVGLVYWEKETLYFLPSIILLLGVWLLLGIKKPKNTAFYGRDGFVIVAIAWLILSISGAIPLAFSDQFKTPVDALFEIVSGFTTTGASVLARPELLPKCLLFWRSFSHWVGGMGVLVFVMAIMPLSDDRSMHLMRAEVPGPVVGKLVPRMKKTAVILYQVYTVMTLLLFVILLICRMPIFDAFCHAFATAGTGGFSISSSGFAAYGAYAPAIEIVIGIFMLLFGINFNLYYLILIKRVKDVLRSEELRTYLIIVAVAVTAIFLNTLQCFPTAWESLRHAFFQTAAIITTTGFASTDFTVYPMFSQSILLLLMVFGGCAGSTAGGLKLSRVILLCKSFGQEIKRMLHPRAVTTVRLEGKPVERTLLHATFVYFVVYVMIIAISTLLLSLDGFDLTTNFSGVLSCFNNIGPGLGELIGPSGNFSVFSIPAKLLLSFNMLLGRLEIFPMLILFSPSLFKKNVT